LHVHTTGQQLCFHSGSIQIHALQVGKSQWGFGGYSNTGAKWEQQAKALRQELPSDLSDKKPWTDFARCQGISTHRQRELLDLAFLTTLSSRRSRGEPCSKRDIIEGLFVDVSQAIDRKPWGPLRTVCGGSQVYSYQKDRLLIPEELLRLLGFATSRWCHDANVSRAEVTALAGSGMALPSVSVVCLSLMLAAAESRKLDDLFSYSIANGS